jgi:hypothetical protein
MTELKGNCHPKLTQAQQEIADILYDNPHHLRDLAKQVIEASKWCPSYKEVLFVDHPSFELWVSLIDPDADIEEARRRWLKYINQQKQKPWPGTKGGNSTE